jgi:phosphoglycerol transferase MdoB-like AlkP superfamily enzyme
LYEGKDYLCILFLVMKRTLLLLIRQLAFWMLFFNLLRLLFLLYYFDILRSESIGLLEVLPVFWYSINLDLATACYIMVIPFLLLLIQSVWQAKWIDLVNKIYTGIIIAGYSLTAAGEMGIYAEWKTKLTYKVVKYLSHPSEIYNSAETGTFFLLLVLLILFVSAGIFAYNRWFYIPSPASGRNLWFSFGFLTIIPGLLFLGMRGGVQEIPINQSQSYFSSHNILNTAAVNNAFNLYISVFENLKNIDKNPYLFMDQRQADSLMARMFATPGDTTAKILTAARPNIVILIMESWSADLIQSLGGEPGITPEFARLEKSGLLFDQVYASGSRSEQGMACIFSGFPAHPISSITVQPDKYNKLPSLVRDLEQQGYSSSFYFGGQLIYGNIKSYIIFNGFNSITEVYDFPKSIPRGKLGIHDEYTLGYMLSDLNRQKEPFIAALFTVSTHSPWDQPFEKPLKWGGNEQEYINAAYYTDHCLGEFFRSAVNQPWYDSTLFVIVADHSHNSYRNWHPHSKEYRRIPMLFYGSVIREEYRGKTLSKLGNQHDLPATLLAQMNLPHDRYRFSKNLLNPFTQDFAYYSTEDGVGWIRPWTTFAYDKGPDFYYWWTDPKLPDSIKNEGKAYLQTVFEKYLEN